MKSIVALILLPHLTSAFVAREAVPTRTSFVRPLEANRAPVMTRTISTELLDLFNSQVTTELEASQLYLSASIWCDQNDLVGMSSFLLAEANEERTHALSFIAFANKRNIPIKLESLEAPDADWDTPEDMWQDILYAEMENTKSLLELNDAATKCSDHAVCSFLQPFHMEQVNSEDNLRTILAKVRDENKTPGLIRQLDNELGAKQGSHT